jgi:molybdate transport repressor ModE-like protein
MEIRLGLRWCVAGESGEEIPPALIQLLDGIARGGNLRVAAQAAQLSYRHAWGLLKHWEERFGAPLVVLEQGRGADLSRAGERLREVWHKTLERNSTTLQEASQQASLQLQRISSEPVHEHLVLAGSHGFGLTSLTALLRKAKIEPEVQIVGSEEALRRYAAGECQVAGFHLPVGAYGKPLWGRFQAYLQPRRDVTLLVETRELGFMSREGTVITSPEQIVARKLRFLNRQPGSGSRLLLDILLTEHGIDSGTLKGYEDEEYTHSAVAATIASGRADVALGARAAAERFNLRFHPVVTEKYLLVISRETLRRKPGAQLLRLLGGQTYKRLLNQIPGSDSRGSGRQIELKHIPVLLFGRRRSKSGSVR